jgi:hypothetical protein
VAGCGQSAPPAVAVAPAVASETPATADPPADKPGQPARNSDGGVFAFPDDSGGKALAKVLTPMAPPPMPPSAPGGPRERKPTDYLTGPLLPLSDGLGSPPRIAIAPARELRPVTLPDRIPPGLGGAMPELPERSALATGPLTRQEGRDVSKPIDLPILSPQPVADRASLADPSVEFTARSVISPTLPLRTEPAGFLRINLPEPFEHSAASRPRTPVVEEPNRALGTAPPPR